MAAGLTRGALHATAAAAAFTLTGACIKQASLELPTAMVVFLRCAIGWLVLFPWVLRTGFGPALATRRLGAHLWRAGFGVAAMACFFHAIGHLPLAEAMLLTYSTPLWLPFLAWWGLGERPSWVIFPAVLLGFVGVGLIVKPGEAPLPALPALIGAASGAFAAAAMVGIRRMSDTEPAPRIVFYFGLLSTTLSAPALLWHWQMPSVQGWALMLSAGTLATVGQLSLTRAYAAAPAALIGPFVYLSVLFSALLAWVLWEEQLDAASAVGIALVVLTCVWVGWLGRRTPTVRSTAKNGSPRDIL